MRLRGPHVLGRSGRGAAPVTLANPPTVLERLAVVHTFHVLSQCTDTAFWASCSASRRPSESRQPGGETAAAKERRSQRRGSSESELGRLARMDLLIKAGACGRNLCCARDVGADSTGRHWARTRAYLKYSAITKQRPPPAAVSAHSFLGSPWNLICPLLVRMARQEPEGESHPGHRIPPPPLPPRFAPRRLCRRTRDSKGGRGEKAKQRGGKHGNGVGELMARSRGSPEEAERRSGRVKEIYARMQPRSREAVRPTHWSLFTRVPPVETRIVSQARRFPERVGVQVSSPGPAGP